MWKKIINSNSQTTSTIYFIIFTNIITPEGTNRELTYRYILLIFENDVRRLKIVETRRFCDRDVFKNERFFNAPDANGSPSNKFTFRSRLVCLRKQYYTDKILLLLFRPVSRLLLTLNSSLDN